MAKPSSLCLMLKASTVNQSPSILTQSLMLTTAHHRSGRVVLANLKQLRSDMKLVVIGIVVGLALAIVTFMAGVWTQSVRCADAKNVQLQNVNLQSVIENEVSDIKAKLEKMDTKLDILVRIATSPVNPDLVNRP